MGLAFSIASSIYPILGFVMGAFALKLVSYKRLLFSLGCVVMSLFGFNYIVRAIAFAAGYQDLL